jgi:hypothetical protein
MTYKPKRDSRHITLKPEALKIYDQWKADGEASKVSDAIIAKAQNSASLEQRIRDMEVRLEKVERIIEGRDGE